ncbi:hypothetical protein HYG86_09300 [Alkalicella caledoniensis]|uniref:Uncharacterized protein n=1 Tax=Alkalicella caledoniensis TaxID=2731377 RepID=A0A7G9W8E5_ALKCA|nr:hypothetical protein [Alkalicella caledoniensis]QNO14957.1 hypothetical protein HYG86_09300 [Alkalicella caledoniensis]
MDERVIDLLLDIKKELQDIKGTLEPKEINVAVDGYLASGDFSDDLLNKINEKLSRGEMSLNQAREKLGLKSIDKELTDKTFTVLAQDNINQHMEFVKEIMVESGIIPSSRFGREVYKQFELNLKQNYEIREIETKLSNLINKISE